MVLNVGSLKAALLAAAVSVPAPLNANEFCLSTPALLLHASLRERKPLTLTVARANVYGGCNTMARQDASFN